jgi:hypothetical protein
MVSFQTKNPSLGKFWRAWDSKMLIYFMATLNILRQFGKFYDHLVHSVLIWYIFSSLGIMLQEESGNPGKKRQRWLKHGPQIVCDIKWRAQWPRFLWKAKPGANNRFAIFPVFQCNNRVKIRVTRLGEFSPIGRFVRYSGQEITSLAQIIGLLFPR